MCIFLYIYTKSGALEPKNPQNHRVVEAIFSNLWPCDLDPLRQKGDSIAFNALLLGHSKGWEVIEGGEMEDCRRFFGSLSHTI